jgi:hypothetical protein
MQIDPGIFYGVFERHCIAFWETRHVQFRLLEDITMTGERQVELPLHPSRAIDKIYLFGHPVLLGLQQLPEEVQQSLDNFIMLRSRCGISVHTNR